MSHQAISDKLHHLQAQIREFEIKYHRQPHSVSLLAVSKAQALEKIQAASSAGQLKFGENYLQEALEKIDALHNPELEWHFIGSIQSNKTRPIAAYFTWVHTVCSMKIAKRLNEQRPQHLPPLNICLEVKVSKETSKVGLVAKEEILTLAKYCASLPQLRLRGLMTIPALQKNFNEQRMEFRKLYELQQWLIQHSLFLDTLSMGMTEDMEAAIAEGATIVRIGRGIFGERC